MRETGTVLVERAGPGIVVVRLNRPAKLNALNVAMFADLRTVCESLRSAECGPSC